MPACLVACRVAIDVILGAKLLSHRLLHPVGEAVPDLDEALFAAILKVFLVGDRVRDLVATELQVRPLEQVGPGEVARRLARVARDRMQAVLHGPRHAPARHVVFHPALALQERAHRVIAKDGVLDLGEELHECRVGRTRPVRGREALQRNCHSLCSSRKTVWPAATRRCRCGAVPR